MKIQAIDKKTNKPLSNTKIQLQIKGKDSGYVTAETDNTGYFELDNKYSGQQVAYYLQGSSVGSQWTTATDGAKLLVTTATTTAGAGTTSTTKY